MHQIKFLLLLIPFAVAGCATTEPAVRIVIQKVEVPIAVPCKAIKPLLPEYSFDNITVENDIYEKVQALLVDKNLSKAYQIELEAALESCIK